MTKDLLACSFIDSTGGFNIILHFLHFFAGISRDRTRSAHLSCIQFLRNRTIVIGLQSVNRYVHRSIGSHCNAALLELLVVLITKTTNLVDLDTTLYQGRHNLSLRLTSLMLLGNVLNDLFVGHALGKTDCHAEHTNK